MSWQNEAIKIAQVVYFATFMSDQVSLPLPEFFLPCHQAKAGFYKRIYFPEANVT